MATSIRLFGTLFVGLLLAAENPAQNVDTPPSDTQKDVDGKSATEKEIRREIQRLTRRQTWSDMTGKYSVLASYKSHDNKSVTLESEEKTIRVLRKRLGKRENERLTRISLLNKRLNALTISKRDKPAPVPSRLVEDFSTDPRTRYGMKGDVAWNPGVLTLGKDASWKLYLEPDTKMEVTLTVEPATDDDFAASESLPEDLREENNYSSIQLRLRRLNGDVILALFARSLHPKLGRRFQCSLFGQTGKGMLPQVVPRRLASKSSDGSVQLLSVPGHQKRSEWKLTYQRGQVELRRDKALMASMKLENAMVPFTDVTIDQSDGRVAISKAVISPGLRKRSGTRTPSPALANALVDDFTRDSRARYSVEGTINWQAGQLELLPKSSITIELSRPAKSAVVAFDLRPPKQPSETAFGLLIEMSNGDKWMTGIHRECDDGVDVTTQAPALLMQADDGKVTFSNVAPEFARDAKVKGVAVPGFRILEDSDSSQWSVRYRKGNLQLRHHNLLIASYAYRRAPKLKSVKILQNLNVLEISQFQISPSTLVENR